MKAKITLKSLLLLCALIVGGANSAWADDSTLSFTKACGGSGTSNDGLAWTVSSDASESTFDSTSGIHYGTTNATVEYVTLTTTNLYTKLSGKKITKIVVNARDAQSNASITVSVGSTSFTANKDNPSISNSSQNFTFDGEAIVGTTDQVIVDVRRSSEMKKAIYVKSVVITYETVSSSTPSITTSNVEIAHNATNGSIGYQLANATGNVSASVTSGDWLTLGTVTASAVPFTCSANTATTARTAQVKLSFTGATDKVVTVTQAAAGVANPSINVTSSSPTSFSYVEGNGPSDASTISVSGSNLTANISISFGDNSDYEMSLAANGTYTNSLTLTQSEGTVSKTTIYFRLKAGLAKGTHNGTLTLSSTGATDVVINLSGTVTGQTNTINVDDNVTGGTIEANLATAYKGQTVTLNYSVESGYWLSDIVITKTSDGSATNIIATKGTGNSYTFEMPDYDVAVTAKFVEVYTSGTFAKYSNDITEGYYVITYSTNALKNSVTSNRFDNGTFTATNNLITNPDGGVVWYIKPNGNYWNIYNVDGAKYAAGTGTKNQGALIDAVTDYAKWTVTQSNGTFQFENYGRSQASSDSGNKWLRNNGTNGWACYANTTGGALTLYKLTDLVERTITFDGNGGTYNEATTYTQNVYDGVQAKLDANKFTKTDYEFAGWNTNANGENGTAYADGANITVTGSDLTLYAQWAPLYTLTVDANIVGGSVGVEGNATSAIDGTEITLTATPTAGHKFSAWNVYKAGDESTTVTVSDENKFSMPAYNVVISATFEEVQTYSLITNANQLVSGKHYIIVGKSANTTKVMGAQSNNNRAAVAVTETNNKITETDGVYEFVLCGPDANGRYALYDATGFLYAAGSSSNYLRTQTVNDKDGKWAISFADGKTTIDATGSSNRSVMQFNSGNSIFSCYETASQSPVYLYAKDGDETSSVDVKFADSGYATYCSPFALDLTPTEDYAAWTVTGTSGTTVTFSKITGSVPADTPFILYGENYGGQTATLSVVTGETTALTGNILKGTLVPTPITTQVVINNQNYTNFGLSGGNFVKIKNGTLPANKAYLPVLTSKVPTNGTRLTIVFNDETTGISDVSHLTINGQSIKDSVYDLQGRRVVKSTKGLYIVNGKKVVIK